MASGDNLKNLLLLYREVFWQYQLEGYTDDACQSIQKALNKARDELFDEITMRDMRLPAGRENAVLKELNDLTLGIQGMLFGNIQEAAMVAGEKSFEEYNNIVSFDGKLAETVGFDAVAVSPAQLQAMVQAPVGGKLMEEWVANSFESHIVDDIKTAILADNLRGLSIDKTIEMLTDSFDMIGRDAETLARTYIADINNQAAEQVYKANDDIIQEEEWCATLEVGPSGRSTCLRCAAMDSRRFKINEDHIRPPLHHNCRCFMLPITASYRELGLDIPEMRKSLRPYTEREDLRKIVEAGQFDGEFKDFLKTRSKKHQIDLLGPNRYRLLQEGKIRFEDLVDKNGNMVLLKKGEDGGYVGLES